MCHVFDGKTFWIKQFKFVFLGFCAIELSSVTKDLNVSAMVQRQHEFVSIVSDSYLQYAQSILTFLHVMEPQMQWDIDWRAGRRLEHHAWKTQPADRCLAVISGNDFHKKSKGSGAGVLSQTAWENTKKDIVFSALSRLWNDMINHSRYGARIVFFGTGQNYRNGWRDASDEDLERFSAFMHSCKQYCVESGMDAVWYNIDHINLCSDGWHPTIACSDMIASDLIGVVKEIRVRQPQPLAIGNHGAIQSETTAADSHQPEPTTIVADSRFTSSRKGRWRQNKTAHSELDQ